MPKTKPIVVKTCSFLKFKPTAIPTTLMRAAKHAIVIKASMNFVVSMVVNVA